LREYIEHTAHQYIGHASQIQAKPPKLGCFGNERRWFPRRETSPGVGDYDLTNFKSFAKANETSFEIPRFDGQFLKKYMRNNRAQSAVSRTIDYKGNDSRVLSQHTYGAKSPERSRSPGSITAHGTSMCRRLGGPQNPTQNYMMQASREQRKLVYV